MIKVLNKVIGFAEECLKGLDTAHGSKHARVTAKYAKLLAEKEGADTKLCVIAAWLHDIERSSEWVKETIKHNHGIKSADKAKRFLYSIGLEKTEIEKICEAISLHCFPGIQESLISKILWDADKLNFFSKEMEKDYLDYWFAKFSNKENARRQLNKERKFYIKHFNTETAVKLASYLLRHE